MLWQWLLLATLLLSSAFFSGMETALFALSRRELSGLRRDRRSSYRLVPLLLSQSHKLLLALMIGNVTCNLFIFATTISLLQTITHQNAALAAVIGLITPVLVTLLADLLPKGIALVLRERLAVLGARLVQLCMMILAPATWFLSTVFVNPLTRLLVGARPCRSEVSTEELQELIEMSQHRKIIDADENAMLSEVLTLSELKVRNVMVPRVDIAAFEIGEDPDELRDIMRTKQLNRLPIYRDNIDHIVGMVYARDLFLEPEASIEEVLRPVRFVPEIIKLTQLLKYFRQSRTHVAIAVDEHGGVVGMVSVQDVAERIVGELAAPPYGEDRPAWEQLDERRYRVSGSAEVREWAEHFNIHGLDERITTLAGLILAQLGRLPVVGDQVRISNLLLTVDSLRGRRIDWLVVELIDAVQNPTTTKQEGVS